MLYDKMFLQKLDESHNKKIYAKVIALDLNENVLEEIQGKVTQGSVNVDGASAVRRSCSITLVSPNKDLNDYYWTLNTKFKLLIGVENNVSTVSFYPDYPDIIWFKMGTYVLTSFNASLTTNNCTVSLQGKDKMCLLNGDISGQIKGTHNFGIYDYYEKDTNNKITAKLPIKEILIDGIHTFANEPFHNIIIKDVADGGLELLEYRRDEPMYLLYNIDLNEYSQAVLNGNSFQVLPIATDVSTPISQLEYYLNDNFLLNESIEATRFRLPNAEPDKNFVFQAQKITYGSTAGYRECELVYAGDLIANAGDAFTTILDKIKNQLGDFEYFYNLDGQFVFQRKPAYVNTLWTPLVTDTVNNLQYIDPSLDRNNIQYFFTDTSLFTSIQNQPQINNLKNDFTVWGERTTMSGGKRAIHARYAIDEKPVIYRLCERDRTTQNWIVLLSTSIDEASSWLQQRNIRFDFAQTNLIIHEHVDWRELIYRMALDYRNLHINDDFSSILTNANPWFITGKTGYEQYYTDLESFWRDLYDFPLNTKEYDKNISLTLSDYNKINEDTAYIEGMLRPLSSVVTAKSKINLTNYTYVAKDDNVPYAYYYLNENYYFPVDEQVGYFLTANTNINCSFYYVSKTLGLTRTNSIFTTHELLNDWSRVEALFHKELYRIDLPTSETLYTWESNKGTPYLCRFLDSSLTSLAKELKAIRDTRTSIVNNINNQSYSGESYSDDSNIIKRMLQQDNEFRSTCGIYLTKIQNNKYKFALTDDALTNYFNSLSGIKSTINKFLTLLSDYSGYFNPTRANFTNIYNNTSDSAFYTRKGDEYVYLTYPEDDVTLTLNEKSNLYKQVNDNYVLYDYSLLNKEATIIIKDSLNTSYDLNRFLIRDNTHAFKLNDIKENNVLYNLINKDKILVYRCNNRSIPNNTVGEILNLTYYTSMFNYTAKGWNPDLYLSPQLLDFWFDFLDIEIANYDNIGQYSVKQIGDRPKVTKETTLKSIYYRNTPKIIFYDTTPSYLHTGYKYLQLPELYSIFSISSQGIDILNKLDELVYNHTYCPINVTINSIPIYYLEVNSRINIEDDETNIHGDYAISKLSYSLAHGGTMNITAAKVPENSLFERNR